MHETEDIVKANIRKHFGLRRDLKIFNNPVGEAWISHEVFSHKDAKILKNPQRITFGLCVGSSDLIGWLTINGVAIFVALEVKTKTGRPRPEQINFIDQVRAAGGIAGIVRGVDDVNALLNAAIIEYSKKIAA